MNIFNNQYVQKRIEKSKALREIGINPYSNKCEKNISLIEFKNKFAHLTEPNQKDEQTFTVAGRIKFLRLMGKAAFAKIEDQDGILQVYYSKDSLADDFELVKKYIEVGDIVQVSGYAFVTKTCELSLHASALKILTKSINPLPEKFHGLVDKELRYRQRYLDLIMNAEIKKTFVMRSKIVSATRQFFEQKGFLEVETPMLHPIAGGANAKPFITHHNALNVERFLRIAPELYLKRLVVGGFEAVFELNRNFRNEGMDSTHNPEFTMLEFYWAYKTYQDLMALTKEFFAYLFDCLSLPKQIEFGEFTIDFDKFSAITYDEALVKLGGLSAECLENEQSLTKALQDLALPVSKLTSPNLGNLKALAFDELVESKLINPTFITDFPIQISPLARRKDENKNIAERFELFIAGQEIANGFSELNDPIDQFERFKAQVDAKNNGDEEAHQMDEDYINALSYGMSPTAGQGMGLDRLVMILTNNQTIKDVMLFPAMKPIKDNE